ncbi:hypothetical protein HZF05_09445 [Sphingomonas sp. CGMCC 1.13654]|uniref:Uncharacterized protein n=1 Tax=Sphingomonas chungangi TaxID=2683589 RepID=A0A838L4M3_9SPHN|nr:hypothetical protein [Sphingomonas chungangi]MBA2934321.1 hypothetical protein [Sphingomonas chungangi]MVW57362.1 hypothetical protein [Sphingomonas chungangi]
MRLDAVFKDAGHYVAAMSAAYLHASGGLTIPLLKQICAGSGFMSPNRARAIVDFLLHIGYLEPPSDDPVTGAYRPTDRFLRAWCIHLQAALDAASSLIPDLAILCERLTDPEIFATFLTIQASRLHALSRMPDPFPGLRSAFLHPNAGSQILWALALAGTDDAFEPVGTFAVPLRHLAQQFGVTDLHVRRLIDKAGDESFLVYHGQGRHSFTTEGFAVVRFHFASQLSEMIECARQLHEDCVAPAPSSAAASA